MSYYRPSQTVAMSRGGRGYSAPRGSSSYRGSGRGGSTWNDRGGGRGSFSSSRGGRFSSWSNSHSTSFDSRSRYSSSGTGERYSSSSRGRPDEGSFRRSSYRSEGPNSYTSRDASTRSPDRKRMRTEAPSSRRSHDGGYGDGYGNAGRYESSQSGGGGGGGGGYSERRSSFADERRSTFRPPRDEYRKPVSAAPSATTRASPRGGYRGRVSSRGARGAARLSLRDGLVRRRVVDTATYLRKRGTTMRSSTTDYLRRLRISRLRSVATRRTLKKGKSSEKDDSDKDEEQWDEEEEEEEEEAAAAAAAAAAAHEDEKSKREPAEGKDEEKKCSPPRKLPKKEDSDREDKKSGSDGDDRPRSKYTGRKFIPLTCLHCAMKCVTFREYSLHLFSGRHIAAMRKVAIKQKTVLARMRQAQRSAQRELEKNDSELASRTIFCPLCKLNYRQMKGKHQMSEAHRNMKKFLMPYCRVCHITFKSPMLYENHMCSLEHIRRKASNDLLNGEKHGSDKEHESPVEEDLENFMTLDSVGDVDEEDEEGNKIAKSPVTEPGEPNKPKEAINVGVEHVRKVQVYYCDLCHTYLPRHEDEERALKQHCRGRMHLQRYVRYKEDKDLRRQAERIHRKSQEAKEAKEKEKEQDKTEKPVAELKDEKDVKHEPAAAANEEDTVDDKMWADVDKDLGEILAEVNTEAGNKSSDEDEDSRPDGERYDRFRYSEKGGDEKDAKAGANEKEAEEKRPVTVAEKNNEEEGGGGAKEKMSDEK